MIADFIKERRLQELDTYGYRPREIWRRRLFLLEQARSFEGDDSESVLSKSFSLGKFILWADEQQNAKARLAEGAVAESDDDAVRIMTIHAAKGLEFPIVFLLGMNNDPRADNQRLLVNSATKRVELSLSSDLRTSGYEELQETEKTHSVAEEVRLAYVGATRARDHLLVSLYDAKGGTARAIQELRDSLPHKESTVEAGGGAHYVSAPPKNSNLAGQYDLLGWEEDRNNLLVERSHRQVVTATWIAQNASGARVNISDPTHETGNGDKSHFSPGQLEADVSVIDGKENETNWQRPYHGRGGTAFGSAVHGVLQEIVIAQQGQGLLPLGTDADVSEWVNGLEDDISRLAALQVDRQGLPNDRRTEVARLVRRALQHDAVVAALKASNGLWAEIPVAAPMAATHGPVVVEGIIDLLYQDSDGGLVVIDYKTDDVSNEMEVQEKMAQYQYQGAAYAFALNAATGKPVRAVKFLFIRPSIPVVQEIEDLEGLVSQITDMVGS